jgi:hypothetical protein
MPERRLKIPTAASQRKRLLESSAEVPEICQPRTETTLFGAMVNKSCLYSTMMMMMMMMKNYAFRHYSVNCKIINH